MYEAARRLLRSDGGTLTIPETLFDSANRLILSISDKLPSMINEPMIETSSIEDGIYFSSEGELGFAIANIEPEIGVCWINIGDESIEKIWSELLDIIDGLANAGYPGCVGCGGPGSQEIWDEVGARAL